MQITIPVSIEDVKAELNSDWQLVTAKEWRRAAIVYAFTEDVGRGRPKNAENTAFSISAFARLGFHGLTAASSVAHYRDAWKSAIDDYNAPVPQPGMSLDIGVDWKWPPPGLRAGTNSMARLREALITDPAGTVGRIIKDTPEVIPALARGVVAHPQVAAQVTRQELDHRIEFAPREPQERDYSKDFRGAVDRMLRCLDAMRAGEWEPDALERTLAHFMASAWTEATGEQPNYSVIDEIEAFLATAKAA